MSDDRAVNAGKLPEGLERLLAQAASDAALLAALLAADPASRASVARGRGAALSAWEEAVLRAISAEQLRAMVDRLASIPPRPSGPPSIAAMPAGIRPDYIGPTRGIQPGMGAAARGVLVASAVATGAMATYWAATREGGHPQGAVLVAVPQVAGLEVDEARLRIEAAGLKVGEVRGEKAPRSVVEASAPVPGTPVERGTAVQLTVRRGE